MPFLISNSCNAREVLHVVRSTNQFHVCTSGPSLLGCCISQIAFRLYREPIARHARLIPAHKILALLLRVVAFGEEHALIPLRLLIRTDAAWLFSVSADASMISIPPEFTDLDFLVRLTLRLKLGGKVRGRQCRLRGCERH